MRSASRSLRFASAGPTRSVSARSRLSVSTSGRSVTLSMASVRYNNLKEQRNDGAEAGNERRECGPPGTAARRALGGEEGKDGAKPRPYQIGLRAARRATRKARVS